MATNEKKNEITVSERFTNSVLAAFGDVAKGIEITERERKLISNYYIEIDKQLKNSKQKYNWKMVRMNEFALTLAHTAKLGLDMSLPNMLSFIPFKHGDTGTIDMTPVIGAKGYEYIAKTYGLTSPISVTVELVYSTDKFIPVKKDYNHDCDSYTFEITNPFSRGDIVGGFGYLSYEDKSNNRLLIMSKDEILKYRPKYFDQTFWTGENEKKMFEKTIAKQLLKKVTLDPDKVNAVRESFAKIETDEMNYSASVAKDEVDNNVASGEVIDIEFSPVEDTPQADPTTGEVVDSHNEYADDVGETLPWDDI